MTPLASFRRAVRWAALALLLLGEARGHIAGSMGYAKVSLYGGTVRYSLTLGPDALAAASAEPGPRARPAPRDGYEALADLVARKVAISADGVRCEPVPGIVTPPSADRANAVVTVDYACPDAPRELALRDDLSDALGRDYQTIVRVEALGSAQQYTLEADRREARVGVAAPTGGRAPEGSAGSGVFAFFRLGVEHILTGFDHLLFLVAVVLIGAPLRAILGVVTAFTVAHSVTLAVAATGLWTPRPALVEPAIALSIAWVGIENVVAPDIRRRWRLTFLFGLVHGFGFAGALREVALPASALPVALASFNAGVEAGQLAVLAFVLPLTWWLTARDWFAAAGVRATSGAIAAVGLGWFVVRVAG